jgi:hypothetical protein
MLHQELRNKPSGDAHFIKTCLNGRCLNGSCAVTFGARTIRKSLAGCVILCRRSRFFGRSLSNGAKTEPGTIQAELPAAKFSTGGNQPSRLPDTPRMSKHGSELIQRRRSKILTPRHKRTEPLFPRGEQAANLPGCGPLPKASAKHSDFAGRGRLFNQMLLKLRGKGESESAEFRR